MVKTRGEPDWITKLSKTEPEELEQEQENFLSWVVDALWRTVATIGSIRVEQMLIFGGPSLDSDWSNLFGCIESDQVDNLFPKHALIAQVGCVKDI